MGEDVRGGLYRMGRLWVGGGWPPSQQLGSRRHVYLVHTNIDQCRRGISNRPNPSQLRIFAICLSISVPIGKGNTTTSLYAAPIPIPGESIIPYMQTRNPGRPINPRNVQRWLLFPNCLGREGRTRWPAPSGSIGWGEIATVATDWAKVPLIPPAFCLNV